MTKPHERIRQLRRFRGFTMQEAAQRAGFKSAGAWSLIEYGTWSPVRPRTRLRIAMALNAEVEDIWPEERPQRFFKRGQTL